MCSFFFFSFFFIENIIGRLYNIQNSKLCFRDMKIMSLRNGGDFGKQLVLRTLTLSLRYLLITFANSLDPGQDQHFVVPDLDSNCLTL